MSTELQTREENGRMAMEPPLIEAPIPSVAWKHSASIVKFAEAFVAAQAEIEGASKDKENPHFKSKYADLSSVMDACKPALAKYGIAVLQFPVPGDKGVLSLETTLLHKSGEFVSGRMDIPLGRVDPQGYGSALTYARRYSLAAMTGVCPEDDDGEAAMKGKPHQQAQDSPRSTKPASKEDQAKDDADFAKALKHAFKDRTYSAADQKAVVAAILARWNVTGFGKLNRAERQAVLNFVKGGEADEYRAEIES